MRAPVYAMLVAAIAAGACASLASSAGPPPSSWSRVATLKEQTRVVVSISPGTGVSFGANRVEARIVAVTQDALTVASSGGGTLTVPRGAVIAVDVLEADPLTQGMLLGGAIALGTFAAAGGFTEPDFTTGGRAMILGLFVGGGVGLGAVMDAARPDVRRIYERPAAEGPRQLRLR